MRNIAPQRHQCQSLGHLGWGWILALPLACAIQITHAQAAPQTSSTQPAVGQLSLSPKGKSTQLEETESATPGTGLNITAYSSAATVKSIAKDQAIQSALKQVLGSQYGRFRQSFEQYKAPYLLASDKALYVEGETANRQRAGAFTVYRDGTLYAVMYDATTRRLTFYGNDPLCAASSHPTMIVFAKLHPGKKFEAMGSKSWCATSRNDVKNTAPVANMVNPSSAVAAQKHDASSRTSAEAKTAASKAVQPSSSARSQVSPISPSAYPAAARKPSDPKSTQDQRRPSRYDQPAPDGKRQSAIAERVEGR